MTSDQEWRELLKWSIGDRLRKVRRAANVDQAEFAEIIQETRESLSKWESGRARPRNAVAIAKRIQLAYGIPAAWTLGVEDDETPGPDGSGGSDRYQYTTRDSNPEPAD